MFLAHLDAIERLSRCIAARHSLDQDERDDFVSWVNVRLIEDDYAVVRKFEHRSSPTTYFTVVIINLCREYRAKHWGRWRSSAAARRLGAVAIQLERLLYRDGHALAQAGELLRTSGVTRLSDRALAGIAARLPVRGSVASRWSSLPLAGVVGAGTDSSADHALLDDERAQEWLSVRNALEQALSRLANEDHLIMRLRYWEGLTVAEISRQLGLEQKPLYRRIGANLKRIRTDLRAAGIDAETVNTLLSESAL
jgi:RNA polymerase sigma factor for flagellar operon FliA